MKDKKTESLVRLAKQQDPDAFTELIERQMQGMYKVACSILRNHEEQIRSTRSRMVRPQSRGDRPRLPDRDRQPGICKNLKKMDE